METDAQKLDVAGALVEAGVVLVRDADAKAKAKA